MNTNIDDKTKNEFLKKFVDEKYDDLLNDINAYISEFGDSDFTFSLLGNIFYNTKKYKESIDAFQKEIKISEEKNFLPYYNLGRNYERLGDSIQAIKNYLESHKLNPNKFETNYNLGMIYAIQNNNIKCEEFLSNAYNINSQDHMLIVNYLSLLHKLKKYQEGVKIAEKAPKEIEKYFQFTYNYALILYEVGDLKKANNENEKVLNAIKKDDEENYTNSLVLKMNILNDTNENKKAIQIGLDILEKDPHNYATLKSLSTSFAHIGNHHASIMLNRLSDGNIRFENGKSGEINLFLHNKDKVLLNG
tara:strand:- start:729 stop:1643 length:915 start_codon:yes stop_codon:yes gene_type:complete